MPEITLVPPSECSTVIVQIEEEVHSPMLPSLNIAVALNEMDCPDDKATPDGEVKLLLDGVILILTGYFGLTFRVRESVTVAPPDE